MAFQEAERREFFRITDRPLIELRQIDSEESRLLERNLQKPDFVPYTSHRILSGSPQIPFLFVVADSIYGNSPDFTKAVDELRGVTCLVSMPEDTLCWLRRPLVVKKEYRFKGQVLSRLLLKDPEKESVSCETIARNLTCFFWYRRKVSEGTKGPVEYEFTERRVVLSRAGFPGKEV